MFGSWRNQYLVTVWSSRWGLSEVIRISWAFGYFCWAKDKACWISVSVWGVAVGVASGVISTVGSGKGLGVVSGMGRVFWASRVLVRS